MGIHIMPPLYELVIKKEYGPPITVKFYSTYNASAKELRYSTDWPGQAWSILHNALSATSAVALSFLWITTSADLLTNFRDLHRQIICFPSISLPSGAIISSARVVTRRMTSSSNAFNETPSINLYGATPANPSSIAVSDYDQCGTIAFSSAISHPITGAGWDEFILNALGIAYLQGGSSNFSVRISWDTNDTPPTWTPDNIQKSVSFSLVTGEIGPPDTRTFLEITYRLPI